MEKDDEQSTPSLSSNASDIDFSLSIQHTD
jgi:hypothetical protein